MELELKKRNLVKFLSDSGILIEPDFLEKLNKAQNQKEISMLLNEKLESKKSPEKATKSEEAEQKIKKGNVKVVWSYEANPRKNTVQDFINYFNSRYNSIKKILQQRAQLENVTSINKLKGKSERETAAVIVMVSEKAETKNGLMITVEDPTGSIKVFFSKNKQENFNKAKDTVLDEVIGIVGSMGNNIIFANDIIFPEVPVTKELKKSPIEEYAIVASDLHVGSKYFLEDDFLKFVSWLKGEVGNEKQREIASKVKYIFIAGDIVDGISNHPGQFETLNIFTFREQYKKAFEYIDLIPKHIQLIISPGNHDIMHLAEPQPALPKEYCPEIWDLPNAIMVSNPAIVNIGSTNDFSGFDVLIYHGYSYNYYADVVESIRIQKPSISDRADLVMKFLMQKRHLTPTHNANPHLITPTDFLVIEKIPDIFISADVHKAALFTYKQVISGMIGSCFQSQTAYQEKVGHTPDPGRIPIINLKTREMKILNFRSEEK